MVTELFEAEAREADTTLAMKERVCHMLRVAPARMTVQVDEDTHLIYTFSMRNSANTKGLEKYVQIAFSDCRVVVKGHKFRVTSPPGSVPFKPGPSPPEEHPSKRHRPNSK